MEFEPLCDVFCFVLCFGILISSSAGEMLRWITIGATRCERSGRMKRTNHRIRVLASMYSCSDKERMFMGNIGREEVERFITTTTSKDGAVTEYLGSFLTFQVKERWFSPNLIIRMYLWILWNWKKRIEMVLYVVDFLNV